MPLGNLVAQIAHAARESARGQALPHTHVVVLSVPDEAALLRAHERLVEADVVCTLIREPDAPFNGAATALGCLPISPRQKVRRLLSGLPLLRGETK